MMIEKLGLVQRWLSDGLTGAYHLRFQTRRMEFTTSNNPHLAYDVVFVWQDPDADNARRCVIGSGMNYDEAFAVAYDQLRACFPKLDKS